MGIFRSAVAGVCLGLLGFGSISGPSHAASHLSLESLPEYAGDNLFLLRDETTGLDWLRLNLTRSISYDAIVSGAPLPLAPLAGTNPIVDWGFRHATSGEVRDLITGFGITEFGFWTPDLYEPVWNLMSLVSQTRDLPGWPFSAGFTSTFNDDVADPRVEIHFLRVCQGSPFTTFCSLENGPFNLGTAFAIYERPNESDWQYGHWLVRASPAQMPAPGTLWIFATGLLGLMYIRLASRRRTQSSP